MPDYFTIHIPQGRGARLGMPKEITGVIGLYTNNFSSCVIISAMTQFKAVLIHADYKTSIGQIFQELEWIDDAIINLFYRESHKEVNATRILKELKAKFPEKEIRENKLLDTQHGILLSFFEEPGKQTNGIRLYQLPRDNKPDRLIFHPKEQQFLSTQKIEQIIGFRQLHDTGEIVVKEVCIFDCFLWKPIEDSDLCITKKGELTEEEMSQFTPQDDYVTIARKLIGIAEASKTSGVEIADNDYQFVMPVAFWLEGYLNNFDADMLLRRNIKSLLDPSNENSLYSYNSSNQEDASVAKKLLTLNSNEKSEDYLKQFDKIIIEYQKSPHTEFKKSLLQECSMFRRHHSKRIEYQDAALANLKHQKRAKELAKIGLKSMVAKNYSAAKNLFAEALHYCIISCDMSDKILVSALFNYARADQRSGNPDMAKSYLSRALTLVNAFDPGNLIQIKIKMAIAECEEESANQLTQSGAPALR